MAGLKLLSILTKKMIDRNFANGIISMLILIYKVEEYTILEKRHYMRNILSIALGTQVTGKEINDWCWDQILNHRSHEDEAQRLIKKNYRDGRKYEAIRIRPHEQDSTKIGFARIN